MVNLLRGADHVCSPEALRRTIQRGLPYRHIEDAAVRLVVVATDLRTGEERRLERGPVVDAVLASAAIPGVFPPVLWEGALLVDGGVVANLPLAAAAAAGAHEAWVLDTSQLCTALRPPSGAPAVALQCVAMAATARAKAELACPPGEMALHVVRLACSTYHSLVDFSGTDQLIAEGAAAAREALRLGGLA